MWAAGLELGLPSRASLDPLSLSLIITRMACPSGWSLTSPPLFVFRLPSPSRLFSHVPALRCRGAGARLCLVGSGPGACVRGAVGHLPSAAPVLGPSRATQL